MNFQEILDKHRVSYKTEGQYTRAGWIQFQCCFCGGGADPNKPYCGYSIQSGAVHCWNCGKHRVIDTLIKLTGLNYREVKQIYDRPTRYLDPKLKYGGKLVLPKIYGPLETPHRKYLEGRGYDVEKLVQLWHLKGIGLSTQFQWRILIPIEVYGETVSWTTRSISDNVPDRYISAKESQEVVHHKHVLYGEDYCQNACIVVEGPTDVWRVGPGAVGTFGTGFSMEQVWRIIRYPKRILCFDNGVKQKKVNEFCRLLQAYPGKTYNVVLDAPDPGSASPKEIKKLRRMLE